jgi:hypothetical protein
LSEVHVRIGAVFGKIAGGRFVRKPTGAFVLAAWTTAFCPDSGADQFSASFPPVAGGDEMVSSGIFGVVAQPARKKTSAPQKRIPADLNTRQLCGT